MGRPDKGVSFMTRKGPVQFITKAIKRPGALRSRLAIPTGKLIPTSFLQEIRDTPVGKVATNPTAVGVDSIRVTNRLNKQAVLALTLRGA